MQDILQCYKILGIEPGAAPERVRNAYVQLSRFYDPERYAGEPEHLSRAQQKRKEIEDAYQAIRHFLPELQDPDRHAKEPTQDRDFKEMVRETPAEVSKGIMGVVIGGALVLLFAWAYYIFKESRLIKSSPTPVVVSED